MWAFFRPPAPSSYRVYADGKSHAISEMWRRWSWLTYWAVIGLLALELVGVIWFSISQARRLQTVGFVLMLLPVLLVVLAAFTGLVALAVALAARLRRWALERTRGRHDLGSP
jgi:hypothetical protein